MSDVLEEWWQRLADLRATQIIRFDWSDRVNAPSAIVGVTGTRWWCAVAYVDAGNGVLIAQHPSRVRGSARMDAGIVWYARGGHIMRWCNSPLMWVNVKHVTTHAALQPAPDRAAPVAGEELWQVAVTVGATLDHRLCDDVGPPR